MIRTETSPDSITEDQISRVIEAVKGYLKKKGYTQARLARELVVASPTVNQILKGTYGADPRPIIAAMDRWLERRHNADAQPQVNRFIWTEPAKLMRLAAQRAIMAADAGIDTRIALVWGDPGCGKTVALEAIAQAHDGIMLTCGTGTNTPRAILEKIARELRVGVGASNSELFRTITDRLRGSGKLLIIDEIHALLEARDDGAFHTLRRLSDQTSCPQLWAATCNLIDQLRTRERKREPLGQIIRRIGCQIHLTAKLHGSRGGKPEPIYTVEHVLQMFGSNEMRLSRDAARFLARLCMNPMLGLLGTCTGLVLHATVANRDRGGELTAAMIWETAQLLFQDNVVAQLESEMHDEINEMNLVAVA